MPRQQIEGFWNDSTTNHPNEEDLASNSGPIPQYVDEAENHSATSNQQTTADHNYSRSNSLMEDGEVEIDIDDSLSRNTVSPTFIGTEEDRMQTTLRNELQKNTDITSKEVEENANDIMVS